MRAAFIEKHGGREVLQVGTLPTPAPGPGDVLVNVKAAALNHLDVHTRRGLPGVTLPMPHVLGCDGAGIVAAHGPGVASPPLGERVAINPLLPCHACRACVAGEHSLCHRVSILGEHRTGTMAEYVVVPARNLLPMPDGMSFEAAAAAPLVYQTAWRMLRRARVAATEDVLVVGASGGVGSALVQLARFLGARVFATASTPEKAKRAQELGADVVLPSTGFAKAAREATGRRGVDVVADHVGKDVYPEAIRALARGGRYVTCGATTGNDPPADLHYVFWNQLEVLGSTMASFEETRQVWQLVAAGKVGPVVDSVLPLEAVAEGHRKLEARDHFGKVVLRL